MLHRIGSVNYLVDMHDARKREWINMLKKWNTPTYGNYTAEAGEDWMEEEIPKWRGDGEGVSKVGVQL